MVVWVRVYKKDAMRRRHLLYESMFPTWADAFLYVGKAAEAHSDLFCEIEERKDEPGDDW